MKVVRIDIISDLVCPWCYLGHKQLDRMLTQFSEQAHFEVYWQPFELNPTMAEHGEVLTNHLEKKYDLPTDAIVSSQKQIEARATELEICIQFDPAMKIYNTRKAHQLLLSCGNDLELQKRLRDALFDAYFSRHIDISDSVTLITIAEEIGLEAEWSNKVLENEGWHKAISKTEKQWLNTRIEAVPTYIFSQQKIVSGLKSEIELATHIEAAIRAAPHIN